jgi:hypothetical protein
VPLDVGSVRIVDKVVVKRTRRDRNLQPDRYEAAQTIRSLIFFSFWPRSIAFGVVQTGRFWCETGAVAPVGGRVSGALHPNTPSEFSHFSIRTSVSGSIGRLTAKRCAPAAARAPGASLPAAWAVVYEKVAGWIAIEA